MSLEPNAARPLVGSNREPLPDARLLGDADPSAPVDVAVVLRRAAPQPGVGADPADIAAVEEFAAAYGLTVTGTDLAARTVGLAGPVAAMNSAFGVDLGLYQIGE